VGLGAVLYPSVSQWVSSYNQSELISGYDRAVNISDPDATTQLALAHEYNAALNAGVKLLPNANVPTGTGTSSNEMLEYRKILSADNEGVMARLRVPSAGVDLPIYHGTSEETLLKGGGHLEGSHLPVGGESTHSVLTAHRGLANATMFTHLNRVQEGDVFTLEVFGEMLSYRVNEIRVVSPEDTESLQVVSGEDLVTLITCTPLGINSHRILVTGERITPTPLADLAQLGKTPDIPGFPWWTVWAGTGLLAVTAYVWRTGFLEASR